MIESAIAQALFKLFLALSALVSVRLMLMWMDRKLGFDFQDSLRASDANVKIYYFSARLIAVAIVIGCALS